LLLLNCYFFDFFRATTIEYLEEIPYMIVRLEETFLDLTRVNELPKPLGLGWKLACLDEPCRLEFHESDRDKNLMDSASSFLNWIYVPLVGQDVKKGRCLLSGSTCLSAEKTVLLFATSEDSREFWFGDGLVDARVNHAGLEEFLNRSAAHDCVKLERFERGQSVSGAFFWGPFFVKRFVCFIYQSFVKK